ncbi:amino acid/amide ABC transporter ATP-binding protein 2, HAAT family [Tistlia consotensis]|uniref:Amino acid/amide ABC transporter ATP-binding protein 2, HAAT family n=1 Tax=Tistlia consotensis USBA 355 TaxID=560819 RepID=A0A1Y6BQL7_9PROT|nr:ABC transporter ATP-binding protein [Tistlia consotensis]SMF24000.1 amino acid/amide ABC transporter ATP-binding protein 2, HAAT family [Tistlia consotensis USBA 355]SNR61023.1 amino acid/amide ABC transporter ATP-binding protein 2, HAAT family [Tistlia consotensis]
MLSVAGLEAAYGSSRVLFGVELAVGAGEALALLGRNGMGKTTTVRAIMGLLRPSAGSVRFEGIELAGLRSFAVARAGLGLVPEGRQVFPNLTVRENLVATARRGRWRLAEVEALFPVLAERRTAWGNELSGGEQQMLAIGRALLTNPKLLILDEATEGLAPRIRGEIWRVLARLKAEGLAILVIDKNVGDLIRLCDRHAILEKGKVAWTGSSAELAAEPALQARYLGV